MHKPLTQTQHAWHIFTTAMVVAAWSLLPLFVWYAYAHAWAWQSATAWGVVLASVPLFWRLNTEVSWRKREEFFKKVARRAGSC